MTQIPLHLKYRPHRIADLIGQPDAQKTLSNAILRNQIPPVLLLSGARGTGKTSTARIIAKSINCLSERPTLTPCDRCQSCRSIDSPPSLDVTEIDAASNNGVDDVRELIQKIQIAPVLGAYRVVIMDEAHQLSQPAQNALLKTLEEPPSHVVFVLCTTEPQRILATIVDRCLDLWFHPLSMHTIATHLKNVAAQENIQIADAAIRAIANACNGGVRTALKILGKLALADATITEKDVVDSLGMITGDEIFGLLKAIAQKDALTLLTSVQTLVESGKEPALILTGLLQAYRDLLLLKVIEPEPKLLVSAVEPQKLKRFASLWHRDRIIQDLDQLYKREGQIKYSSNPRTWLEVILMNLIPEFSLPDSSDAPSTLETIWRQVIEQVKPESRSLLKRLKLLQITDTTAVIRVPTEDLPRIEPRLEKLGKLLAQATGATQPLNVSLEQPAQT
jgi:DNA polymerase III subunit gamma/tau